MLNAGVSLKLGQGNHVSTSRVAMAKELKDLRAELENMKGALVKVSEGKQLNSLDLDKMQLFPDVPENHWAYDYVATLAGNGIIVGYPDGKFGGDRMMTRYEMAALIYRAIQNGAVADEQMARALKEFQPELERIRVDTISKHKDGTPDIQRVRVIKGPVNRSERLSYEKILFSCDWNVINTIAVGAYGLGGKWYYRKRSV